MEAKYTTNKGMLPEILLKKMRYAFARSEELLDLEVPDDVTVDPMLDLRNNLTDMMGDATPEQLGSMLEIFQRLRIGNIQRVSSVSLHAMT